MRRCGTVPEQQLARRFSNFALTLGIDTRVEAEGDAWSIWVLDEDRIDEAREQLERFLEDPSQERYDASDSAAERLRREQLEREKEYRRNVVEVRRHWEGGRPGNQPLTMLMIGVTLVVALASYIGDDHGSHASLNYLRFTQIDFENGRRFDPTLPEIRDGEWWRLVTPMFIHFGPLHLLFNLLMFYFFGTIVESKRGALRYLLIVLVIAVVSNLGQWYWSVYRLDLLPWARDGANPNFGGLSGVLYGLFGYVWMMARLEPGSGFYIDRNTVVVLITWLLLCMLGVFPVANAAHVIGLICGMVLGARRWIFRRMVGR